MECSRKSTRFEAYHTQLRKAIRAFLPATGLELCSRDGRVRWSDRILVTAVLLLIWSGGDTLRDAFAAARRSVIAIYRTRRRPGKHLQGFLKTWQNRSAELLHRIVVTLRQRMIEQADAEWRWKGWAIFGVDGSRINCPRTRANERAFGCAGKHKTTPQLLLVTLFHVASGLPWGWRRTRGDGSERDQLLDMLPELPERSLLLADAGFTGYRLLEKLQAEGHSFIVRVGRNVTLLRKLGYHVLERADTVYLWPLEQRKQAPLVLRLVTLESGRRRMALLTNVLDDKCLSGVEIEMLYHRRWTIEVMFRSLKQTLGKRKLLAETPDLAAAELDWAMTGLWMLGLMVGRAIEGRGAWSAAAALRVVRSALRHGAARAGRNRLWQQLRAARLDSYQRKRSKNARDWPHKKTEQPPGTPRVRMATRAEITTIQARLRKTNAA